MKLSSSFAALSAVVVVALCLGQAHADTVTTPLGLTQVDDNGVPITPLTYLNLEPQTKELTDAAKKVTTPPPMLKHAKRLLPTGDHLEPFVEKFTSQGLSIRAERSIIPELPILGQLDNEGDHRTDVAAAPKRRLAPSGGSIIPELPIFGQLDNEGDHRTDVPAAPKRRLAPLEILKPGEGTEYLPENHQTLGQRTVHPLNRRADDPVDLSFFGKGLDELAPKLPGLKRDGSSGLSILGTDLPVDQLPKLPIPGMATKRDDASGLDLMGTKIPLDKLALPALKRDSGLDLLGTKLPLDKLPLAGLKRDDGPLDLGLKTGNAQDADAAKSLLGGLIPLKRDAPVKPLDLGLKTGNAQDAERAKSFLGGLLPIKRDSISPDNLDLESVKGLANEGAEIVMPIALNQVKSKASPAVQAIKAANGLCSAFGCQKAVQGALGGVTDKLPMPKVRSLGEKDMFADGLLGQNGEVNGIPVRRAQDPVTETVLDVSDGARDAILGVKDKADNAAGEFVKNMYTKHGEVQTRRELTIPGYSLLPGTGPMAKEGAQEIIDFLDLPVPGLKRMDKMRRKN